MNMMGVPLTSTKKATVQSLVRQSILWFFEWFLSNRYTLFVGHHTVFLFRETSFNVNTWKINLIDVSLPRLRNVNKARKRSFNGRLASFKTAAIDFICSSEKLEVIFTIFDNSSFWQPQAHVHYQFSRFNSSSALESI